MFYSIAREESDRLDKNGRGPLSLISMILECVKSSNYRYRICIPLLIILEIILVNGTTDRYLQNYYYIRTHALNFIKKNDSKQMLLPFFFQQNTAISA